MSTRIWKGQFPFKKTVSEEMDVPVLLTPQRHGILKRETEVRSRNGFGVHPLLKRESNRVKEEGRKRELIDKHRDN